MKFAKQQPYINQTSSTKKGNILKFRQKEQIKHFAYDTNDINHPVGAHIVKKYNDFHVDVKDPDIDSIGRNFT